MSDTSHTRKDHIRVDQATAVPEIEVLAAMPLALVQDMLASRSVSPVDLAGVMLDQILAVNDTINALYDVDESRILADARASEMRHAKGEALGPFDGIPVTIKDSVHAVGFTWHHGSAVHGKGVMGTKDAPPAKRLKQAGTIILGKGKMPDFGLSGSGVSGSHGIVRNPWGLNWNTGGSSAGGGASIASGIGMMSVGSDIAGSVRLPASHCGLAAMKPTQGLVPHTPASNVRSAGPITRYAQDLHAWAKLLSGPDADDRYSFGFDEVIPTGPVKVGVSTDFGFGPSVEPAVTACVHNAAEVLAGLVSDVQPVDLQADEDHYLPIDETLKIRGWLEYNAAAPELRENVPQQLKDWFLEAKDWSVDDVHAVHAGIERGVAFAVELLQDVHVLLTPVMPVVNFPADQRGIDPAMPLRHSTFTAPFNQSGHPAISICGGFDASGLPIGLHLVGHRFDDARLMRLAAELESALDVHKTAGRGWPIRPVA